MPHLSYTLIALTLPSCHATFSFQITLFPQYALLIAVPYSFYVFLYINIADTIYNDNNNDNKLFIDKRCAVQELKIYSRECTNWLGWKINHNNNNYNNNKISKV